MRAMRVHHFGPPAVIRQDEIEAPEPDEHQVLVRVAAAGVGPWDGWIRAGKSVLPQPLPLTLGSDLSGTVVALGRGVQDVRVGDEIFGVTNPSFTGAYAEYALAQVGMISTKPRSLPHEQAAGIPVVAVTAKQMLFAHADVRAGQRVLVLGAAGSVGALAVQLANLAGAEVIGTVTNEADLAFVAGLGARQVVDGKRTRFEQEVAPVDVVIDLVAAQVSSRRWRDLNQGAYSCPRWLPHRPTSSRGSACAESSCWWRCVRVTSPISLSSSRRES